MKVEYGKFEVKKGKKTEIFEIEKEGGFFIYRRDGVEKKIVGEFELEVLPLPPVNLPEKISPFFMVNFEPILMSGKSRTVIFLKIPCEIGVFVDGVLIDILGKEFKYVLYGPPSGGWICKNIPSERVDKDEVKPSFGHLYIPLRIKNYTDSAFEVKRVLINAEYLDLYYKGALALTEMMKLDIRDGTLLVRYLNKSFIPNMHKVKAKRMLLKKEEAVEMRWGP